MASTGRGFVVGPDEDPDKYRLRRQLGGGGEAELWEAEFDVGGGPERVAIKILRAEHADDLDYWRGRWAEQVDLLRLVQHPGVVGVHEQFEGPRMHRPGGAAEIRERSLHLAMNWVDGEDLRDWVVRHPAPADRVAGLRLLAQVADTLDYLHSPQATPSGRPVVHGDLSPANVVVDAAGQTVLVDFGLVRVARHVTSVGRGTQGYAAPEVIARGEYSPAADRYAFGGLAYYVLTGTHPPGDRASLRDGLAQVVAVTGGVATVDDLMRIFAEEPAGRPAAGEWIRLLRMQTSTAPVVPAPAVAPPTVLSPAGRATGAARWRLPALVAGAVVVAAVCGGVLGANLGSDEPEDSTGGPGPAAAPTTPAAAAATQTATPPATESEPDPAWPGEPLGEILASDTDYVFGWDDELDDDDQDDLAGTGEGLAAINGAAFLPWDGQDAPTLDECRSIPEDERFQSIPAEQFEQTPYLCLRTTAGRYGYLESDHVVYLDDPEIHYYYVVWKKPGDG